MFASKKLLEVAEARVRARLSDRSRHSDQSESTRREEMTPQARVALRQLSEVLGVDDRQLRPGDRLQDVLRVHREELPREIQPLFDKFGLKDVVSPFALELLDFVERRLRNDPTKQSCAAFVPLPATEEGWINRIMDMTVAELVNALG